MKPTIHLHIGAHKTATTFLQHVMVKLLTKQTRVGAYTLPLWNMRSSFSSGFSTAFKAERAAGVRAAKADLLKAFFAGFDATGLAGYQPSDHNGRAPICVASDENLLGHLVPIIRGKGLYADAGSRTKALMQVFSDYEVKVFMSVRDYKDFYPSAFAQSMKRVPNLSFENFTDALKKQTRGWVDVVEDIESAVGKGNMHVWSYEHFAKRPSAIFKALVPGLQITDAELQEQAPRNPSVGRKTLEAVERLQGLLNAEELKAVTKTLSRFDSSSSDKLRFADAGFTEELSSRYARDSQALIDKGFHFIRD